MSKYIVREVADRWKPTEPAKSLKQADKIARAMLSKGAAFAVVCAERDDEIIREYHAEDYNLMSAKERP